MRGTLSPVIRPLDAENGEVDGILDDTPSEASWWYQPIVGVWPADGCGLESRPVQADTAAGRATLERLDMDYSAAQAFVNMASPMAATWDDVRAPGRDGLDVQLDFELVGSPEFHCLERDGSATFETEVQVSTSDGRLDWTARMDGALFKRPGEPPGFMVSTTTQTLDADAAFWSSTLRGIDLLGSANARVQFRTSFGLDASNAYVDGAVSARLVPECGLDFRCTTAGSPDACGTVCGTPLEVDYLYWSFFR